MGGLSRSIIHPNHGYRRVPHNLNRRSYHSYNLHTLQPVTMQEKTLVFLVNL